MSKSMKQISTLTAGALVLIGLVGGAAQAQEARGGGGASAQMVQQLQQVAAERTELQAQNAKLQKDLDEARKERDALKSGQQALQRRAEQADANVKQAQQGILTQRQASDQEIGRWRSKLDEVVAEARKIAQQLQEVEADRTRLKQTLADRDLQSKVCTDHNQALYQLNSEILTHFERQSVWSRVAQAEPFTQIKRNQLENLLDDYRSRAQDQRVAPASSAPQAVAPTP
jgi:chromosome segregation ATPase